MVGLDDIDKQSFLSIRYEDLSSVYGACYIPLIYMAQNGDMMKGPMAPGLGCANRILNWGTLDHGNRDAHQMKVFLFMKSILDISQHEPSDCIPEDWRMDKQIKASKGNEKTNHKLKRWGKNH